jgi:hypothetical protein
MVKADLTRDYYGDLELPQNADINDIKRQFKKLGMISSLSYLPDKTNSVSQLCCTIQIAILGVKTKSLPDFNESSLHMKYSLTAKNAQSTIPTAFDPITSTELEEINGAILGQMSRANTPHRPNLQQLVLVQLNLLLPRLLLELNDTKTSRLPSSLPVRQRKREPKLGGALMRHGRG